MRSRSWAGRVRRWPCPGASPQRARVVYGCRPRQPTSGHRPYQGPILTGKQEDRALCLTREAPGGRSGVHTPKLHQ
eukprot:scaffold30418_cov66-Phaeocystis_antarctica.AAC.2